MATSSFIGLKGSNDIVGHIYCHNDGYLYHNGKILLENYDTFEKVAELIKLGDISSLKESLENCKPYNEPAFFNHINDFINYPKDNDYKDIEYFYLFDNGEWLFSESGGNFRTLKESDTKK